MTEQEKELASLRQQVEELRKERDDARRDERQHWTDFEKKALEVIQLKAQLTVANKRAEEAEQWANKCEASQAAWQANHAKEMERADKLQAQIDCDESTLENFLRTIKWIDGPIKRPIGRVIWKVEELLKERDADQISELRKKNRELEVDRERLDWLEKHWYDMHKTFEQDSMDYAWTGKMPDGGSVRDRIDAARANAGETK